MGKTRDSKIRAFETCRTIDVTDKDALKFWSRRMGVSAEEITEAVKEVGANSTAVALKLDAPADERVAPPGLSAR